MRTNVVAQALVYVLAGQCMYTATRSRVNRRYSRAVRALVDIQDILYPSGHRPRRSGRMPNGYPSFRLRNVELPSPIDEDYDSDEAKCHKRMHIVLATRVIRRLLRNVWAKRNWRRFLYFLCWVFRAKPLAAKQLAKEQITTIAQYVGRGAVMDQATAVHRTVFAPPYREWQSSRVQFMERTYGDYPLRKL